VAQTQKGHVGSLVPSQKPFMNHYLLPADCCQILTGFPRMQEGLCCPPPAAPCHRAHPGEGPAPHNLDCYHGGRLQIALPPIPWNESLDKRRWTTEKGRRRFEANPFEELVWIGSARTSFDEVHGGTRRIAQSGSLRHRPRIGCEIPSGGLAGFWCCRRIDTSTDPVVRLEHKAVGTLPNPNADVAA
jgi:hypothetical protein